MPQYKMIDMKDYSSASVAEAEMNALSAAGWKLLWWWQTWFLFRKE